MEAEAPDLAATPGGTPGSGVPAPSPRREREDTQRIRIQLPIELLTLGKLCEGISEKFPGARWVNDEGDEGVMVIEVDQPRSSLEDD